MHGNPDNDLNCDKVGDHNTPGSSRTIHHIKVHLVEQRTNTKCDRTSLHHPYHTLKPCLRITFIKLIFFSESYGHLTGNNDTNDRKIMFYDDKNVGKLS